MAMDIQVIQDKDQDMVHLAHMVQGLMDQDREVLEDLLVNTLGTLDKASTHPKDGMDQVLGEKVVHHLVILVDHLDIRACVWVVHQLQVMVLQDRDVLIQVDPHLVTMDPLLMDLTCHLQAAQAQEWVHHQCHLLVSLQVAFLQVLELPHPVVTLAQVPHLIAYPLHPHPLQSMTAQPQQVIL